MLYEITILLCFTANIFFVAKFNAVASAINLFDIADNQRKLHEGKVALLGGLILFSSLLIFSINLFQNDIEFLEIFDFSKKKLFDFFNFFLCLFFIWFL